VVNHVAEQYGTLVVPGSFFGASDHLRVGYGGPTGTITEGLRCLGAGLDDLA
jgi:aspartate/methionine/tyrosine aminotransferase